MIEPISLIDAQKLKGKPALARQVEARAERLLGELRRAESPVRALLTTLEATRGTSRRKALPRAHALAARLAESANSDLLALSATEEGLKAWLEGPAGVPPTPSAGRHKLSTLVLRMNELVEELVTAAEHIDFRELAQTSEETLAEEVLPSFQRIWGWCLSVLFETPSSRYYWPEFRAKALLSDNGRELRRRLITYNYAKLSAGDQAELRAINAVHACVLRRALRHSALNRLLDCLKFAGQYVELHSECVALRLGGATSEETRLLHEEERKFKEQALRLNAGLCDRTAELETFAGALAALLA